MEEASFVVRASDPLLKAIYQCPDDLIALRIRDLVPGDTTSPPEGKPQPVLSFLRLVAQ